MDIKEMTNEILKSEFEEAGWAMEACESANNSVGYEFNKASFEEYKAELVRRGFRVEI